MMIEQLPTQRRAECSLVYLAPKSVDPRVWCDLYNLFGEASVRRLLWFHAEPDVRAFIEFADQGVGVLVGAPNRDRIMGCVWFNDIVHDRASVAVCYAAEAPGHLSARFTMGATVLAAGLHGFEHVWAQTPWRRAVKHARRCGSDLVATLPDFATFASGRRLPLYVLKGTVSHAKKILG